MNEDGLIGKKFENRVVNSNIVKNLYFIDKKRFCMSYINSNNSEAVAVHGEWRFDVENILYLFPQAVGKSNVSLGTREYILLWEDSISFNLIIPCGPVERFELCNER